MNEQPTPETDAVSEDIGEVMGCMMVDKEFAQKLERERDEARGVASGLAEQAERLRKERDEARNKMADALQEVDLRTLDYERMKKERDEAREVLREIAEANGFENIGNWARNKARKEIDRYREKNDLLPISWDV